jgi:tRNA threonylcarbamoyladenosine biosynthesis protein TsaB
MSILAIDTTGDYTSIAIIDCDGKSFVEKNSVTNSHVESFFSVLHTLFNKYNYNYDKINHLAVVTGPGSFTGIRVGLSAAVGMNIAINKPLYGVTALEVRAYALRQNSEENIRSIIKNYKVFYTQLFNSNLLPLSEPEVTTEHDETTLPKLNASHAGLLVRYRLKNKQKLNDAKALYLNGPTIQTGKFHY